MHNFRGAERDKGIYRANGVIQYLYSYSTKVFETLKDLN